MSNLNCCYKATCPILGIGASIIIGIITILLRITAVITLTPAFLWVLLGISVVYLLTVLAVGTLSRNVNNTPRTCLCPSLSVFLTGILGTILTSVILLAIEFVATSIIGAIITGALLLFFSLIITSSVCLVKCVTGCSAS